MASIHSQAHLSKLPSLDVTPGESLVAELEHGLYAEHAGDSSFDSEADWQEEVARARAGGKRIGGDYTHNSTHMYQQGHTQDRGTYEHTNTTWKYSESIAIPQAVQHAFARPLDPYARLGVGGFRERRSDMKFDEEVRYEWDMSDEEEELMEAEQDITRGGADETGGAGVEEHGDAGSQRDDSSERSGLACAGMNTETAERAGRRVSDGDVSVAGKAGFPVHSGDKVMVKDGLDGAVANLTLHEAGLDHIGLLEGGSLGSPNSRTNTQRHCGPSNAVTGSASPFSSPIPTSRALSPSFVEDTSLANAIGAYVPSREEAGVKKGIAARRIALEVPRNSGNAKLTSLALSQSEIRMTQQAGKVASSPVKSHLQSPDEAFRLRPVAHRSTAKPNVTVPAAELAVRQHSSELVTISRAGTADDVQRAHLSLLDYNSDRRMPTTDQPARVGVSAGAIKYVHITDQTTSQRHEPLSVFPAKVIDSQAKAGPYPHDGGAQVTSEDGMCENDHLDTFVEQNLPIERFRRETQTSTLPARLTLEPGIHATLLNDEGEGDVMFTLSPRVSSVSGVSYSIGHRSVSTPLSSDARSHTESDSARLLWLPKDASQPIKRGTKGKSSIKTLNQVQAESDDRLTRAESILSSFGARFRRYLVCADRHLQGLSVQWKAEELEMAGADDVDGQGGETTTSVTLRALYERIVEHSEAAVKELETFINVRSNAYHSSRGFFPDLTLSLFVARRLDFGLPCTFDMKAAADMARALADGTLTSTTGFPRLRALFDFAQRIAHRAEQVESSRYKISARDLKKERDAFLAEHRDQLSWWAVGKGSVGVKPQRATQAIKLGRPAQ